MIKKILGFIPFMLILSFSSCIAFGDIYCTYELEGRDSNYEVNPGLYSKYNKNKTWNIIELNDKYDVYLRVNFEGKGSIPLSPLSKGYIWVSHYDRTNYTEPYDMVFVIGSTESIFDYTDRMIFNEMLFQSKNNSIDIREKVAIKFNGVRHRERMTGEKYEDYTWHKFKDEELIDFRSFGIIDLSKYKNEWKKIETIYIEYNNIDVVFKKDPYFNVKFDINFEGVSEPQHYNFMVKFIRKKFKVWASWFSIFTV